MSHGNVLIRFKDGAIFHSRCNHSTEFPFIYPRIHTSNEAAWEDGEMHIDIDQSRAEPEEVEIYDDYASGCYFGGLACRKLGVIIEERRKEQREYGWDMAWVDISRRGAPAWVTKSKVRAFRPSAPEAKVLVLRKKIGHEALYLSPDAAEIPPLARAENPDFCNSDFLPGEIHKLPSLAKEAEIIEGISQKGFYIGQCPPPRNSIRV